MRVGVDGRSLRKPLTGIGRYTSEMIAQLVQAKLELTLYLPSAGNYQIPEGVRVRRTPSPVPGIVSLQTIVPFLAAQDQIDVFWGPSHRLPVALPRRIPAVLTIHDLVWVHAAQTMHPRTYLGERLLMGRSIRRADVIVVDSQATARDVQDFFGPDAKTVKLIYPGAARLPKPVDGRGPEFYGITRDYVLFVGTLEPRKNLRRLVEAYALLPEAEQRAAQLVIVGAKGWGRSELAPQVAASGLTEHVRVLGYVPDRDLAMLYARCLFVAMPSLYEGFGFPVVEANLAGRPALIGDTASLPEVGGDAALAVDPQDTRKIAAALARLIADSGFREFLAANAEANAARFTWERAGAELKDIFEMSAS